MDKKGFTLIELLAVIVVLAIIALIATPIVMNTIEKSKKGAAERTADNYIKQVEVEIAEERLDNNVISDGTYGIDSDGNLVGDSLPEGKLIIDMSGEKPTSGSIVIKNEQVDTSSTMIVNGYSIAYNTKTNKYEVTKKEIATYKIKVETSSTMGVEISADSNNPSQIEENGQAVLKYNCYSCGIKNMTVTGAEYEYKTNYDGTGIMNIISITLKNPTEDVNVSVRFFSNGSGI